MASAKPHLTVIACGYLASIAVYSRLPGPYLDHRLLFARPVMAFLLPTMAAVTCLSFRRLWARDLRGDQEAALGATYSAILLQVVLFVIVLHVMVLAGVIGLLQGQMFAPRVLVILFGLLFVGVGNLLPRTRPNLVIGWRTSRMLANRDLWMHMHRIGGYVTVGLGVVIVLAGILFSKSTIPNVVGAAVLVGAAVVGVSYWRYGRV